MASSVLIHVALSAGVTVEPVSIEGRPAFLTSCRYSRMKRVVACRALPAREFGRVAEGRIEDNKVGPTHDGSRVR